MGARVGADIASVNQQQAFVARLIQLSKKPIPETLLVALEVPQDGRPNLARLNQLVAICDAVGEPRWVDVFRFWTVLCRNLDYFLTTDRKFLNSLRELRPPRRHGLPRSQCNGTCGGTESGDCTSADRGGRDRRLLWRGLLFRRLHGTAFHMASQPSSSGTR